MDHSDPDRLMIIAATPPHRKDKAGPTWLELDADRCRKEIIHYNKRNKLFIGYWHTHPQTIPEISPQDIQSFKRFSDHNSTILPNPVAIIVGQSTSLDGIRIWSIRPEGQIKAEVISV